MATTTLTNQFKLDLAFCRHAFKASGGIAYKIALIKPSPSGTYDKTLTNYGSGSGAPTTSNIGTDEVASGAGYTTGGFLLTNVDPAASVDDAVITFSANPVWTATGAGFSAIAGVIYTADATLGTAGRTVGVFDFGGTQTASGGGTLTLTLPTANSTLGLIRIGPT